MVIEGISGASSPAEQPPYLRKALNRFIKVLESYLNKDTISTDEFYEKVVPAYQAVYSYVGSAIGEELRLMLLDAFPEGSPPLPNIHIHQPDLEGLISWLQKYKNS